VVRYLLEKGANPDLVDANGKKPIDLLVAAAGGGTPAPAAVAGARGGRGGAGGGGGGVSPATAAEIRTMLQNAASKK
jgi:hypothetical protein